MLGGFIAACSDSGVSGPAECSRASANPGKGYCLVEPVVVRVTGAASLTDGAAMLAVVDDATAVILGRDADGFFARSAICTHACCIVTLCDDTACSSLQATPDPCAPSETSSGQNVLCPCHGSVFRLGDGLPLNGPATTPLPAYALSFEGDDVLVDTGSPIDVTVRFNA